MKVSQVMLAKGFGGAERLFVDLCIYLSEAGLQVQAICITGSKSAQLLSRHPEVLLQTISVLGTWDPFAPFKIARLLKAHKTQVVQAHLARGAILSGKACNKLGLPLVVTTHNYIDIKYYKHVSVLLPPTKHLRAYYLSKGIDADKLKIINHFSPIEPEKIIVHNKRETIHILALGRLVHKKGFHVLLDAFAKIQLEGSTHCELHIGGTGPEQQALLTQIRALGLEDKVSLIGWVDDVASFLKEGDVFVLPSLDEPFGIVVLEAMAMGLPIVSMDSQGPKEILDEDSAWLFTTGDSTSLAATLQDACNNQDERKRKGDNALLRFKNKYSKQAVIPEFMALYHSLVEEKTMPFQQ
ncbi:MAG: glycosyltransferase involved in cell wall biosynthesis [Planctomycetota bacterium]|jgi:glycosyltransferase involved in cell wall biosynthesis